MYFSVSHVASFQGGMEVIWVKIENGGFKMCLFAEERKKIYIFFAFQVAAALFWGEMWVI